MQAATKGSKVHVVSVPPALERIVCEEKIEAVVMTTLVVGGDVVLPLDINHAHSTNGGLGAVGGRAFGSSGDIHSIRQNLERRLGMGHVFTRLWTLIIECAINLTQGDDRSDRPRVVLRREPGLHTCRHHQQASVPVRG